MGFQYYPCAFFLEALKELQLVPLVYEQGYHSSHRARAHVHQRLGWVQEDDRILPNAGTGRADGQDGVDQGARTMKGESEREGGSCASWRVVHTTIFASAKLFIF